MRWFSSLGRLAIIVWIAWIGLLSLLAGMLAARFWHPHFLPVTATFAVLLGAGIALVVAAAWRLVRGPRRMPTLGWLLLGTAPLYILSAHFLYGLEGGYGRSFRDDLPVVLLAPFGESLMDLEARFRYRMRTTGDKVVMISQPFAGADGQVALMDAHIRGMEDRLGRTMAGRVHWVRGPLLNMDGRASLGVCLGSRPEPSSSNNREIASLDRHEVAHCVIAHFCSIFSEPPAVLSEGWAEANSGIDPAGLKLRARASRPRQLAFAPYAHEPGLVRAPRVAGVFPGGRSGELYPSRVWASAFSRALHDMRLRSFLGRLHAQFWG